MTEDLAREIYEALKQAATSNQVTSYEEIAPLAELVYEDPSDREDLFKLLEEINLQELQEGRPMLSSVVVRSEGLSPGLPGEDFFRCAKKLGLLESDEPMARINFWAEEARRTFRYWSES